MDKSAQDGQRTGTSEGTSSEGHGEQQQQQQQQQDMTTAGSASATQKQQEQGEDSSAEQAETETTEAKSESQTEESASQQVATQTSGVGVDETETSANCDSSSFVASAHSQEEGGKHRDSGTCSAASAAATEAAVVADKGTGTSSSNRHVATSRRDDSRVGTSSDAVSAKSGDMEGTTNASALQPEQSQQETEVTAAAAAAESSSRSNIGTTSSRNARSRSPIEVMAEPSGFNINLSSLPPGAYMVEPANPPVRRESYINGTGDIGAGNFNATVDGDDEGVLTAEVREAGAGEGGAEDQSVAGASRSSISTITNPNFGGTSRSSVRWTAATGSGTGTGNTDDALHHVVTATCVDEECVVDACPVPDEDEIILVQSSHEEQKQQIARLRKRQRFVLGGAVLALVAIATALGVALGGGGNNGGADGGDSDGVGTAGTAVDADRLEALRSIVLPLSGEGAFDPTSLDYSEQRVSALNWLASDRYATEQLPAEDPSLTWKIRQRYVMGLFHIMTDSANWFDSFNSLTDRDECDWNRASSLDGKEAEDHFTGVQKEVEIKGIICNEMGQVKRIILWWNNLSGELPHELSYFSESLVDLNLAGGSISGPIPDSYGNLTKLGGFSLPEQCLTGTVPESLTQLTDLAYLTLYGNPELRGSLNGLCDGDQFRSGGSFSYVSADCGDCPGSEALLECDCCTCCDSDTFDCCDKDGNALWKYINLAANPQSGKPFSFDRDCLTEEGALWAQEECPCVVYETEQQLDGRVCSKECSV